MSDKEKVSWLQALVIIWAPPIFINFLGAVASQGNAGYDVVVINAWMTIAPVAVYLLILSWRMAYLSGGKKR
jgi:hypothetical protein